MFIFDMSPILSTLRNGADTPGDEMRYASFAPSYAIAKKKHFING
jgi:hypothetical protein